jgi:DNA modification methylase
MTETRYPARARLWIDYLPVDEVARWPRNPKKHDLLALRVSMDRWGFTQPILRDENSGRLVAGHGRVDTLADLMRAGDVPPDNVDLEPVTGRWLVPVVRGLRFADEAEAEAYLLADNRLQDLGGYDDELLAKMLADARATNGLEGTGYTELDADRIARQALDSTRQRDREAKPRDPDAPTDALSLLPENPTSVPGEVYKLGSHRLMCGDSTNPEHLAKLLDGHRLDLVVTDPPYGVEYDATWRGEMGHAQMGANRTGKVAADDRADWTEVWVLWRAPVFYVWHASWFVDVVKASLVKAGFDVRALIVWNKSVPVMSRGAYHWKHEVAWYAVRKGERARWLGDRKQTTVWDEAPPNHIMGGSDDDRTPHPTQKPIRLIKRPIRNHVPVGGNVGDPFGGSGTTILAAEELGARAFVMELDPRYCDVIRARWERYMAKHEDAPRETVRPVELETDPEPEDLPV